MPNQAVSRVDQFNDVFNSAVRLNNTVLAMRNNLVRDLGLTSGRWQVLDEAHSGAPVSTASSISRKLGLSRQAVQRIVNDLEKLGMISSHAQSEDKRAYQIAVEAKGIAALVEARSRLRRWAEAFNDSQELEMRTEATDLVLAIESFVGEAPSPRPTPFMSRPIENTPATIPAMPERSKPKIVRAFEGVRTHVLGMIKNGQLKPGDKLPAERELAVSHGIGRSAVREALRSLEVSGVLRFERGANGGAFVRQSGPDGISASIRVMLILGRLPLTDLLEVRASLLGQCARLGTDRATPEDLDKLDRNIDELEERIATIDDQLASIGPATDFYRLAARAAHNPLMVMLVDAIADLVAEMLTSLHQWPRLDAVSARRNMVAAMRAGKGDEADRIIRLHSHETNQLLLKYGSTPDGSV